MKLPIITDTHLGIRNDSLTFLNHTKKFLDEVFFPYLKEHKLKRVIHLGDLVDRRKYINFYTAKRLREDFLDRIEQLDIIVGNHDVLYKDTNKVNALHELVAGQYPHFNVYIEPTEIVIDDVPILMVPWINQENRQKTFDMIQNTKAQICFGHLDITGFEMYKGIMQIDGDNVESFNKFDMVLTGHFHYKSSKGNIHYLGAPLQFTWADYNDPKGFHVFDTDTRELTFIKNPFDIFKKLWYNDHDKTIDDVINNVNFEQYKNSVCKLIVQEKTNPFWFDMFVDRLDKVGICDLLIVEDHNNFDVIQDDEIVDGAEDTLTIFNRHIDQLDEKTINKDSLKTFISGLYIEAVNME